MRIFRIGVIIYRLSNKNNFIFLRKEQDNLINVEKLLKEFKDPYSPVNDRFLQKSGLKHFYDGEKMFNIDCDLYKKE